MLYSLSRYGLELFFSFCINFSCVLRTYDLNLEDVKVTKYFFFDIVLFINFCTVRIRRMKDYID